MGYYPAKELRPGLWIGSEGDSQDPAFFSQTGIGFVVNCTKNIPFMKLPGVDCYRIPIDDAPDENDTILSHFPVVVQAIDSVLQRGKGVLVHCRAGMQRSAATVAAYIMFKYKLGCKNAIAAIKTRKTETFWPVPTFGNALGRYEKQLAAFNANNNVEAPSTPRRTTNIPFSYFDTPNSNKNTSSSSMMNVDAPSTPRRKNSYY